MYYEGILIFNIVLLFILQSQMATAFLSWTQGSDGSDIPQDELWCTYQTTHFRNSYGRPMFFYCGIMGLMMKTILGVKTAHTSRAFKILNKRVTLYKDTTNTSYIWGCIHTITNYTIYMYLGTISTVYFKCKFRTTSLTSEYTRTSRRQGPMNQKGNKSQ